MRLTRRASQNGFTFVELIVAGTLFTVITLIAMLWVTGTMTLWSTTSTQDMLREAAEQTMNRMLSELRNATRTATVSPPNATIPAAPGNTTITFYLPVQNPDGSITDNIGNTQWGLPTPTAIQYTYVPSARQVRRVSGASTIVYGSDVQSLTFDDVTTDASLYSNEVRIALTLQKTTTEQRTVSARATSIVKLRN